MRTSISGRPSRAGSCGCQRPFEQSKPSDLMRVVEDIMTTTVYNSEVEVSSGSRNERRACIPTTIMEEPKEFGKFLADVVNASAQEGQVFRTPHKPRR